MKSLLKNFLDKQKCRMDILLWKFIFASYITEIYF